MAIAQPSRLSVLPDVTTPTNHAVSYFNSRLSFWTKRQVFYKSVYASRRTHSIFKACCYLGFWGPLEQTTDISQTQNPFQLPFPGWIFSLPQSNISNQHLLQHKSLFILHYCRSVCDSLAHACFCWITCMIDLLRMSKFLGSTGWSCATRGGTGSAGSASNPRILTDRV